MSDQSMTSNGAVQEAARLLHMAEAEPNPQVMERYEKLADSWVNIAILLAERERV